jgi:hypothetical protein
VLGSELLEKNLLETEEARLAFTENVVVEFGHRPMLDPVLQADEKSQIFGNGIGLDSISPRRSSVPTPYGRHEPS